MIQAQQQGGGKDSGAEGSAATSSVWVVPSGSFGVLTRCLRKGEDEIVRHYAAKAIENIATSHSSPEYVQRLAKAETVSALIAGARNNM